MIYAKVNPTVSLEKHTKDVIDAIFEYATYHEYKVRKICELYDFDLEKAKDLFFFSAFFHDFGKATPEFQGMIRSNDKTTKQTYLSRKDKYTRHEYYSLLFVVNSNDFNVEIKLKKPLFGISKKLPKSFNLLLLSIAVHHKVLTKDLFGDSKFLNEFSYLDTELVDLFNKYKLWYRSYRGKDCKYEFKYPKKESTSIFRDNIFKQIHANLSMDSSIEELEKLRNLYSLFAGALNIADWQASSKINAKSTSNIYWNIIPNQNYIKNNLKSIWKTNNIKLKTFQKELANTKGNVLVEIPTGEGKTEGSLLWAANNLNSKASKIIYTLPTQVTSNKLLDRMIELFGQDNCGIVHSSARLKALNYLDNEEDWRREKGFYETYSKPLTVSTLDGFLKYFTNIGRYTMALNNFFDSVIIFDEVHTYDMKMLGFLTVILRKLDEYKIPWCIMSASIPDFLKKDYLLQEDVTYRHITQTELFKKKPSKIFLKKKMSIGQDLDFIINQYEEGKNILITCNTVNDVNKIFHLLNNLGLNTMLYHSTFKREDRILKEQEIFYRLYISNKNKFKIISMPTTPDIDIKKYFTKIEHRNFILAATQVVEMSLDIDFDILLTDIAPVESLIQRFGRVNRKKHPEILGEIYIYENINFSKSKTISYPYESLQYYPYNSNILKSSFEVIRNGNHDLGIFNQWLNDSISNFINSNKIEHENKSILFNNGSDLYTNTLELNKLYVKKDYEIRDIDPNLSKVECFLYQDYEIYGSDLYKMQDKLINIPVWLLKELRKVGNVIDPDYQNRKYNPVISNLEYSYIKGLTINDNSFELNNII